ncbi:hypothetical protein [Paenibacillus tuaregi]|uniref:hypothetical protein n=1 Tax=Paenibacillus tuaregi TaxID=1816681 RepID=UPI001651C79E|nr:hypothetical protein [Paenibacillus tuaregi]
MAIKKWISNRLIHFSVIFLSSKIDAPDNKISLSLLTTKKLTLTGMLSFVEGSLISIAFITSFIFKSGISILYNL